MTTLTTRAQLCKQKIYDLLKADAAFNGVQVTYGYPTREPEKRWVMVGKITWDNEDWATFGQLKRDEAFSVSVIVNVMIAGGDEPTVDAALFGYFGEIENVLRANPLLGTTGVISAGIVPEKSQAYPVSDGYEGQLEAKVVVKARI